jgi:hypothetical protein
MDMTIPAIGCNVPAAGRLVFDDGLPMCMAFFRRHLFPPNVEKSSLSGNIAQSKTEGKMGCSYAYVFRDKHEKEHRAYFVESSRHTAVSPPRSKRIEKRGIDFS